MVIHPHRRVAAERLDRTEKLIGFVIFLLIGSIFGIYWTLFQFHHSTSAQLKAENCISAKCESPAVKAVINQAIGGISAAVATANVGELQLLCYSLTNLNQTNPSPPATAALHKYCSAFTSAHRG